ncbi:MAG TPA: LamG domain-containing protein, partial [Candidatus Norongarragalinales archaeon]|nr:LamG domain-containing protein [Candidatus Norongarragalinales archaeon]
GGDGGNSSYVFLRSSVNVSLEDILGNFSKGGGANGISSVTGYGGGIILIASNYTRVNRGTIHNISSGAGQPSGTDVTNILFATSSFNEIVNSSIREIYKELFGIVAEASIYSSDGSINNLFINTSFNRSATGWGSGTNNFTVNWYVLANVTNSSGSGVSGAQLKVYNSTSGTIPMSTNLTNSNGFAGWFTIREYLANGTYSYDTYCIPGDNLICYETHTFNISGDGYLPNSTALNITQSSVVWIKFPVNSYPTHSTPTFSPSPPDTDTTLVCLNQSTADADGNLVFNIYAFMFNASGGTANDTLLTYLAFDQDVPVGATVQDYSAYSKNFSLGTTTARPSWVKYDNATWSSSIIGGGAYLFDGGDGMSSSAPHLNLTHNFTIATWVNISDLTNTQHILATQGMLGDDNYNLNIKVETLNGDPHIYCIVGNYTSDTVVIARIPNSQYANKSIFIACSYNTTSQILYVNGTEVNRTDLTSPSIASTRSSDVMAIGRLPSLSVQRLNGLLDEFRIYNKTLSPEQISLLYAMRSNATAAQELAVGMNATCCIVPTDTVGSGPRNCVSDAVASATAAGSFTVFTLGSAGANFTTSLGSIPGNYTEGYYFNTTNPSAQLLVPCGSADGTTSCQSGMNMPAYRIRNTGNFNITVMLNISSSLSGTGVKVCGNSTKPTGCATGVVSACDISGEGNINASAWFPVVANLGTTSVCYDANVTLYATYSDVAVGTPIVRVLTLNATLT